MNATQITADFAGHKDWRTAFTALRQLLSDANDTTQVFRIMRALNAGSAKLAYDRLVSTTEGGRIAFEHVELSERLSDPAYIAGLPAGSVGAAYAAFIADTGYSAQGLADLSQTDDRSREGPHPYSWIARRTRDLHDIWHVLTGYKADDPLGEACLVAFTYAQTGGLGWGFIAVGAMARALRQPGGWRGVRAIWEGYRRGRSARWLLGEDYDRLLAEPLDQARRTLGLSAPSAYLAI